MDRLVCMEAFVRVVDAGSFSAAARNWGRSKAAVSKYLTNLEDYLGVELIRRTTRSLSLTDAGRLYHRRCIDLLGELAAMEASIQDNHVAPRGRLRITIPPGLMSRHRQRLTTEFIERYPEVTMDIHLTHRMVDLIEEGFDLAIRITEAKDSSLIARKLTTVDICAVASPEYLQKHGTPKKPEDLRQHACLIDSNFREKNRWRFKVDGELQVIEVSGPFQVNSPIVIRDLAEQGKGIALIPDFMVQKELQKGSLVSVLDGMLGFRWSMYALYPRRHFLSGRVRAFIDHLVEVFREEAPLETAHTER